MLPRWSPRAALGRAEVEVEGDIQRVNRAGQWPHEKLFTAQTLAQTLPEKSTAFFKSQTSLELRGHSR